MKCVPIALTGTDVTSQNNFILEVQIGIVLYLLLLKFLLAG